MITINRSISFLVILSILSFFSCKKTADIPAVIPQNLAPSETVLKIQVLDINSTIVKDARVELYNNLEDFKKNPSLNASFATKITDANGIASFSTPEISLADSQYYFRVTVSTDTRTNVYNSDTSLFRLDEKLALQKTTVKVTNIRVPSVSK